jgi:pyruvate dehydrogenase E1 component beta subunit
MMKAAIEADDPVVYLEHKDIWTMKAEVDMAEAYEFGKARLRRDGKDITIVSWSNTANIAVEAADALDAVGVDAGVIDLRSLWPWDKTMVLDHVAKTGKLLVAQESVQVGGFGAEVVATVVERMPAKVKRLGSPRSLIAYAPNLEDQLRVTTEMIAETAKTLMSEPA